MSPGHEASGTPAARDAGPVGSTADETPWRDLVGEWVDVLANGRIVDHGRVEAVTQDSSILWLAAGGAMPRRILERTPGIEICREALSWPE